MALLDLLLGRPLASDEARAEQIGSSAGIPIFGLDALSSAANGPEAALTLLIPLGASEGGVPCRGNLGNFGLCWRGSQTVGGAPGCKSSQQHRQAILGVQCLRFRSQKGTLGQQSAAAKNAA